MIVVPVLLIGGPMDGTCIVVRGDQRMISFQNQPAYDPYGGLVQPVQHDYWIRHLSGEDGSTYCVGVTGVGCPIRQLIEAYPEKKS